MALVALASEHLFTCNVSSVLRRRSWRYKAPWLSSEQFCDKLGPDSASRLDEAAQPTMIMIMKIFLVYSSIISGFLVYSSIINDFIRDRQNFEARMA